MINFIYYAIKALVSVNGVVTVRDNLLAAVCYQRISKAAKDFIALSYSPLQSNSLCRNIDLHTFLDKNCVKMALIV